MKPQRVLVTGAAGCLGAWVISELAASGHDAIAFDVSSERRRVDLLLGSAGSDIPWEVGDVTDRAAVERAIGKYRVTHVIHLAAAQIPAVRRNPVQGALVNVVGTVNVFDAALRGSVHSVAYASSVAALDRTGRSIEQPSTLYGVFKRSNEGTAAIFAEEHDLVSVGLRPHSVYGVGRDQGLTSAPTLALLAAAAGARYAIPFGGAAQLQLARDVARAFISVGLSASRGAVVHNLPGEAVSIAEFVDAIGEVVPRARGRIRFEGEALPFPPSPDSVSFRAAYPDFEMTAVSEGVSETIRAFQALLAEGRVQFPPSPG
jgi:nucleoside-diphosphate-sugar epimerase